MSFRFSAKSRSVFLSTALLAFTAGGLLSATYANSAKVNTKSAAASAPSNAAKEEQAAKYRLAKVAVPSEYELTFEPDLAKFTFAGTETVKLQILQSTRQIELNALELKILSAQIIGADGLKHDLESKLDAETQKVSFSAKEALAPGAYELHCKFEGSLNDQLRGFYRAGYKDAAGNKHWLAATQMEPTDARRMFPSFDEPAYKAVFKIRAIINKDHVAISNAPVEREELAAEKKTIVFEASPRMSSYLLCLVIGDLKCSGETKGGNVPIKVWAVSGKEQLGKYALSEAGKILDFQAKYFGVPYPGKKLDLIALPEFSSGAMENIGAITYHDSDLLIDEKTGSSFQRQGIFGTTAHEMAHQWFGDLVTMDWWDDLWLNESFATWMSSKVEEGLHPEWRSMTESVYSRLGSMSTDSLKATRAIHADVLNAAQANEMFDGITYQKGASVLRMLESFVGEEAFQKGVSKYLKDHSFANATAADFWTAIAAESTGVPVAEIMRSYVYQPGFPQVNVKVSADNKQIDLSQYRQLRLGQDKNDPSLWLVPLLIRELSGSSGTQAGFAASKPISRLFTKRSQDLPLNLSGKTILVNAGARGYYRTCYEAKQLKAVQDAFLQLSPEEKLGFIADCSALVLPGDIAVEDCYNIVHKIKDETDPLILADMIGFVAAPFNYVRDNPAMLKTYQHWARHMLMPLRTSLDGWNQKPADSQQTKSLRLAVLGMLGTMAQEPRTISEAFVMFEKYRKDRNSINPDVLNTVVSIVAFNGGKKEYDELLELYKTAQNPADSEMALGFLDSFHQPDLASRTIAMGMGPDVKLQEGLGMVCGIAYNHYTRDIGWAYIKQHWNELLKHFPEGHLRALCGLAGAYDTPEKEKEFKDWYASHPVPFGKSSTARSLESMHTRVLFRQRFADRICKWVSAQDAKVPK